MHMIASVALVVNTANHCHHGAIMMMGRRRSIATECDIYSPVELQ